MSARSSRYVLIVCFFEDGSYWPSHDTPPSDLDWSCYNGNLRDPGFHPLLKAKIAEIERTADAAGDAAAAAAAAGF